MLEQIFTAIGARVNEEWGQLVVDDEEVLIEITDDAVNYAGTPPRLVFVPGPERYTRRNFSSQDGKKEPRQLFTRMAAVKIHIWGKDRTSTEELLHCTCRSTYDLGYGSVEPDAGVWLPRSTNKLGNVYLLDMTLQIPVPRLIEPRVPITDFPTTTDIITDPGSI